MISSTQELETVRDDSINNSKPAINSSKWADEHSGSAVIGDHEIKPVDVLLNLEKKPLECYFEGLQRKPSRCRKIRQPKKKCLDFWDPDSFSATHGGWISASAGEPPKEREQSEVEDRLLNRMLQVKMEAFEKLKERKQQKISMKQRLAEESYLEQQENLAETWLGVLKRRSQLQNVDSEDFFSCPRPTFRTSSKKHCSRIKISLLSKRFWRDDKDTSRGDKRGSRLVAVAKEKPLLKKVEPSVVDNLDEVFGEKLVFVDVED